MINKSRSDIIEKVKAVAVNLEQQPNIGEIQSQVMDVKVQAGIDGTLQEITLITETGGPQIEINVASGTVYGFNGGDSHTTHFNNDYISNGLWDYWSARWEDNR